jgi:hypothetical protein
LLLGNVRTNMEKEHWNISRTHCAMYTYEPPDYRVNHASLMVPQAIQAFAIHSLQFINNIPFPTAHRYVATAFRNMGFDCNASPQLGLDIYWWEWPSTV